MFLMIHDGQGPLVLNIHVQCIIVLYSELNLNIFILHLLRNKFLQFQYISLEYASLDRRHEQFQS